MSKNQFGNILVLGKSEISRIILHGIIVGVSGIIQVPVFRSKPEIKNMTMQIGLLESEILGNTPKMNAISVLTFQQYISQQSAVAQYYFSQRLKSKLFRSVLWFFGQFCIFSRNFGKKYRLKSN